MQQFPHLYRCGHIEAHNVAISAILLSLHFRIFIDAATLKLRILACTIRTKGHFRIFIDAATLKQTYMVVND